MKSLCLFCGANSGSNRQYQDNAIRLVDKLVEKDITLIYGGGNIGLMGVIADRALSQGGQVIGVMPHKLASTEQAHDKLTEMHLVDTMSERKQMLTKLADGFIALPGGIGTLDEFYEVMALRQTGYQDKPIALLNSLNYYQHLIAFMEHAQQEDFINPKWLSPLIVEADSDKLLKQMAHNYNQGS